jgi:hypothetical protein
MQQAVSLCRFNDAVAFPVSFDITGLVVMNVWAF